MKNLVYFFLLFVFTCQYNDSVESEHLLFKSKKYVEAIYERVELPDGVRSRDTLQVHFDKGEFINFEHIIQESGRELELFYLSKFEKNNSYDITLNYEVGLDSIVYMDTVKRKILEVRTFTIDDEDYDIVKRASCFFCKRNPNVNEFYADNLGLLISLSTFRTTKLIELEVVSSPNLIEKLISEIEKDLDFYNLQFE